MGWVSKWTLWNIFLALIPVLAGWLLANGVETWTWKRRRVPLWAWLPLACVWLVFLPNTCYLLTEWRHLLFDAAPVSLRQEALDNPPLKLLVAEQGLFYAVYSAIGILCFALSIRPVAQRLQKVGVRLLVLAPPFFFLISLGVYMGLIVRLNSWDILARPSRVFQVIFHALTTPLLLSTIIGFAFLLWALYEIVDIWVEGVERRIQRLRSRA
jgi:uncharacterized membrane protein